MPVEAFVGFADQHAVEPPRASARLVARSQEHGRAFGVEREGDPPFPVRRAEPHLLHVRMPRAVERVHMRSSQLRSELPQKTRLLGAAVHYRIATGPHAGRKALTLRTVGSSPPPDNPCIAQLSGFSLHRAPEWCSRGSARAAQPVTGTPSNACAATSPARPSRTNASRSMTAGRSCIDSSTPSGQPPAVQIGNPADLASPASPLLKCRSLRELAHSSTRSSPISPPATPSASTAPAHRRCTPRKPNSRPPLLRPCPECARGCTTTPLRLASRALRSPVPS